MEGSPNPRGRRLRVWAARLGPFVLGIAFGLAAFSLAGSGSYEVGPATVEVEAVPWTVGKTEIDIPPLGSVEAHTHAAPLKLSVLVSSVDVGKIERYIRANQTTQEILSDVRIAVRRSMGSFLLRTFLAGTAGGILAAGLLRLGRKRAVVVALAGGLAPVLLSVTALATFDAGAFREPTLTGTLSAAPDVLGPVEEIADRFEQFRGELDAVGATAFSVYEFLSEQSLVPEDAVRLLHISDLHLNPVGFDLAKRVADSFRVHAVIDTGDTTAEGTILETPFLEAASRLPVPYIWVRGNHDSNETQKAVTALPNATVLDGTVTQVEGLEILGFGDPTFTPSRSREITSAEDRAVKTRFASKVLEMVRGLGRTPDVVLIHDRVVAELLAGEVPLVLAGHSHRFERRERVGTLFLTIGSTGGAGIQSLAPAEGEPNALQVLYFSRDERRLVAVDRIEVHASESRFLLTRLAVRSATDPSSTNRLVEESQ